MPVLPDDPTILIVDPLPLRTLGRSFPFSTDYPKARSVASPR